MFNFLKSREQKIFELADECLVGVKYVECKMGYDDIKDYKIINVSLHLAEKSYVKQGKSIHRITEIVNISKNGIGYGIYLNFLFYDGIEKVLIFERVCEFIAEIKRMLEKEL